MDAERVAFVSCGNGPRYTTVVLTYPVTPRGPNLAPAVIDDVAISNSYAPAFGFLSGQLVSLVGLNPGTALLRYTWDGAAWRSLPSVGLDEAEGLSGRTESFVTSDGRFAAAQDEHVAVYALD